MSAPEEDKSREGNNMSWSVTFWDRTAARYAKRPIADQEAYLRKLALTQEFLRPEMDVMEFGCGTASTAIIHAPKVRSYLATDASSNMIEIARQRVAESEQDISNLRLEVATLDELQKRQQRYDAILGLNILHLLPDPDRAIRQVFQMLKPGGVFISNTACLQTTRRYLKPVVVLARWLRLAPAVTFLSREALEQSLNDAGFQIQHRWVPERSPDVYFLIAARPG